MAIARPFRWDSENTGLKEMTDAELEYLSYNFRLYYATQLNTGHAGSIAYDSAGTHATIYPRIGSVFRTLDDAGLPTATANWDFQGVSATDQRTNMIRSGVSPTYPDNTTSGGSSDYAPDPGSGNWDATRTVRHNWRVLMTKQHANSTIPDLPSTATYDADGYIVWKVGGPYFQIDGTVADIAETILKDSNTEMLTGDELGTYRVDSSTPGSDWTAIDGAGDNEFMYVDTIADYTPNAATVLGVDSTTDVVNYKLWLKTTHTFDKTPTDALLTEPFGWDTGNGGSLKQKGITQADNLIQNILYPIYVQQSFASIGSYGYPIYGWSTSDTVDTAFEEIRGTVADTYYVDSSTKGPDYLVSGLYYYDRYGSGSTLGVNWYFKMTFPSTSYTR